VTGCEERPQAARAVPERVNAMEVLHIDLQEGFSNDRVAIEVNGKPVADTVVTSNRMHGHAASLETRIPGEPTRVQVRVISRNLSQEIPVEPSGPMYLGIAIRGGALEYRLSDVPFTYF
jgi:hypothetical protein